MGPCTQFYTLKGLILSDIWARRFRPATARYPAHFRQKTITMDVCLKKDSPHCPSIKTWLKKNIIDLFEIVKWLKKKTSVINGQSQNPKHMRMKKMTKMWAKQTEVVHWSNQSTLLIFKNQSHLQLSNLVSFHWKTISTIH